MANHSYLFRSLCRTYDLPWINGLLTHKRKEQSIQKPQLLDLSKDCLLLRLHSSSSRIDPWIYLLRKYYWSNGVHHAHLTQSYVGKHETTQTSYVKIKELIKLFFNLRNLNHEICLRRISEAYL